MPTRTPQNDVSHNSTNDPFIFEPFVPLPPQPHLNASLSVNTNNNIILDDEDFLRPYIHIFRLDPFSTHDGVHGRPVPAAVRARAPESARPLLLEFQLDIPEQPSPHLSSVEPTEREDEPAKQEDEPNQRRLLYLDGQATYFSGPAHSGSMDESRSPPDSRLPLPAQPEPEPERAQFETTPWSPTPIYHPIPRSPGQAQVHPFSQVERSSEEAYQPPMVTPASEHPFQMRAPLQNFPASLAYHTEAQKHEHMPISNAHGSGSMYASAGSDSSLNMPNHGASVGYNYNSFGYETNGSDGAGYVSDRSPPMAPQPTERPSPGDYQNPYALPNSRSNALGTSLQPHRSHPFSHFPPAQAFQHGPHTHFNTYGNDIPAQPPVTNYHESSVNNFPERLGRSAYFGALDPLSLNKSDGFQPSFLSKPIQVSPSASPTPQHPLLSTRFSPILETSPSQQVSRSPSPPRSMTLSPTPSVESLGSGESSWPRRPRARQRRMDLAPYIPGRMRQQYGKPKEHWCTVCNKPFKRPSTLATHMNIHTGEKPYFCPMLSCGRRFSVSSNLTRHLKTHGLQGATPRGPRAKSNRRSADNERRARNSMAAAASRVPLVERSNAAEAWIPESLRGMRNAKQLSSRAPFVIPESMVPTPITLPPVRPWGNAGDENYEERDSFYYAEHSDTVNPYHPNEWYLRPTLAGPLPSNADREEYARECGDGASELGSSQPNLGGVFGRGDTHLPGSTTRGER